MKSVRRTVSDGALSLLIRTLYLTGKENGDRLCARLAETVAPVVSHPTSVGDIRILCAGETSEWRIRTLLTKEPETLDWISGFGDDDTLWDVGANIGLYSLYAARRGVRVLAFEPSAPNYYLLNRNIALNDLAGYIGAYCLAFAGKSGLDALYMTDAQLGGARNSFGTAVDWRGLPLVAGTTQATVGFRIDEFVRGFNPRFPTHLKIDVDGLESRIVEGAAETLADPRLRSVLIELDTARSDYCRGVESAMAAAGLRLIDRRRSPMFDGTPYASSYNHIFAR
ncbi:MAG: FkbM family methyltransferase [Vicinamibacterales bacterium]